MMHAGLALARRVEAAEAQIGVACADAHERLDPGMGAAVMEVAGGYAIFVGPDSPLTHAVGMGLRGEVRPQELDRMENFYRARGAAISLEVCPLADASLLQLMGSRGYSLIEFNNVLVRGLAGADFSPEPAVNESGAESEGLWVTTVGRGFLEKDELTADEMDVGAAIWHMPQSHCYLAHSGGRAGGAAAMAFDAGLATLFADSTLVGCRGAGLQGALIRERLRLAQAAGCDLATATTLAGSVSQRNYERHGFHVAYTKVTLAR